MFGPEHILENVGEFLNYFMVSKVMAGADTLRASGTVMKKLAKWLAEHDYVRIDDAALAIEQGADAARDLPAAEKLSTLLYDLTTVAMCQKIRTSKDDFQSPKSSLAEFG